MSPTARPFAHSPSPARRLSGLLLLAALLLPLAACDSTGGGIGEGVIREVSIDFGLDQRFVVGEAVTVSAFVTDVDGLPAEGATLRWSVGEGDGSIEPATGVTGPDGTASATWTLGTRAVTASVETGQRIVVEVENSDNVRAERLVSVSTGPVASIEAAVDRDTLAIGRPEALRVVRIVDVYGNEVPDTEESRYGVEFTSLDTNVVRIGPPPADTQGDPGVIVGVEGVAAGTARIIATAAAAPGFAGKGARLPDGAAADTVAVTVVSFVSAGAFPAVALSAGTGFTCGLDAAGAVFCWGANAAGQLGTGDFEPRLAPSTPVALPGPAREVATGDAHTCALLEDGRVFCWGERLYGRLGDGSDDGQSPTPVQVIFPSETGAIVEVQAGIFSSCVRTSDGAAYCWGSDWFGTLGDDAPPEPNAPDPDLFSAVPVRVQAPAGVRFTALSNNASHSCAVAEGGAAYCWGLTRNGRLGVGFILQLLATNPRQVQPPGLVFTDIAAHDAATSALTADGQLYGWGVEFDGSGLSTQAQLATAVATSQTFTAVSGGGLRHGCGLVTDGTISCWGENFFGQLGTGEADTTGIPTPRPVLPADASLRFASVDVGANHTCAVATGVAEAYCWGQNLFGQIGNGEIASGSGAVPVPTRVESVDPGSSKSRVTAAAHRRAWCASLPNRTRRTVSACRMSL